MKKIGLQIRTERNKIKISQQNLASSLGMSTSTINKLENGKLTGINTQLLKKIGDKLKLVFEI
jgi:transcriptional regulator with XRE-family HTH domain